MKRSEILLILEHYKKNYHERYRFSKIGIFGSAARETAARESDIDIVIEQSEPDLFLLGSIKTDLENELDCIDISIQMLYILQKCLTQERGD